MTVERLDRALDAHGQLLTAYATASAPSSELLHPGGDPLVFSDLMRKIHRTDVSRDTIDQLTVITDQLCCEYVSRPPDELRQDAHHQLDYVQRLLEGQGACHVTARRDFPWRSGRCRAPTRAARMRDHRPRDAGHSVIPEVARCGWLIVTRDSRIQERTAEIDAVRTNGARMIALSSADARTTWAQLEVFMSQWRAIERLIEEPGPFLYSATRTTSRRMNI